MARNKMVRSNPFNELDALQRQFFGDDFFTRFRGVHIPTTDVYTEGDKQMTVEAHLPNFDQNDINISLEEGSLVIQAEKREREEDKSKKYMVRESSSSFYRRISLPDAADESKIEANFDNGVLKVTVPFKELPAPRKIAIGGLGAQPSIESSTQGGESSDEPAVEGHA